MAAEIDQALSQETIFKQLKEYNWERDREFQGGLSAILGPSPSPSQLQDLTLRAQCFYFSRKKNVPINFDAYKLYLASKNTSPQNSQPPLSSNSSKPLTQAQPRSSQNVPQTVSPTIKPNTHHQQPPSSSPLPWQIRTSPHPSTPPQTTTFTPAPNANPQSAPYPSSFNEIISLIQSGQPVPGIEEIDPTIAWGHGSRPSLPAKRKPWEKDLSEEAVQPGSRGGTFQDERDKFVVQELPDGEEDEFKGSNWWKIVEERKREGKVKE